jgi:hypothetical protein
MARRNVPVPLVVFVFIAASWPAPALAATLSTDLLVQAPTANAAALCNVTNTGQKAITVNDVRLVNGSGATTVSLNPAPQTVDPGRSTGVSENSIAGSRRCVVAVKGGARAVRSVLFMLDDTGRTMSTSQAR